MATDSSHIQLSFLTPSEAAIAQDLGVKLLTQVHLPSYTFYAVVHELSYPASTGLQFAFVT